MSIPANVHDLIYQRVIESTRIEYKADWNPEPTLHTVTAFANDFDNLGGGYLVIGMEEKDGYPVFPIKGIEPERVDAIQKSLIQKCNLIEPRYIPVIEPLTFQGATIILLWIPGGEDRPYKCPTKVYTDKGGARSEKAFYIRKGSNTLRANALEERELVGLARNTPFDDRINPQSGIGDLKISLLSEYLHDVDSALYEGSLSRPVREVATDMRLLGGPPEAKRPINVGLMFFNERPDFFFPYTQIEVVDKPDPTGVGMKEKLFRGPIHRQLQDALSYIKNYVIAEYVTKVPNQAEALRVYNWPYRAVEEALSNAVYHRSYQIHEPITVTITPEQLEILSLPGPDRSITDRDLEQRVLISSRYRNRRIGDFLKELRLVEGRNTGVPLILSEMEKNGSAAPTFLTDEDRSYLRVVLPIHPLFTGKPDTQEQKTQQIQQPQIPVEKARRSREDTERLIYGAFQEHEELSARELARQLGYKKLNDTLREVIQNMMDSKALAYRYPDKPNSRNQKIYLVK